MANKAGRPKGAVESPVTLMKREVKAIVSFSARLRSLLESCIKDVEKMLKQDQSLETRLKVIDTLTNAMTDQASGIEKIGKHVVARENEREAPMSGDEILKGMMK